ncbi:SRPBCC domain-containing protein [Demequina subtropica]|uniref:SRPBCC domain-containing protein n=1 Tax=Demequina subtropica TaxID=1638989 RepID=UPI0007811626|nr:SRPBCC domain-containing protein [Demequina subtropica]
MNDMPEKLSFTVSGRIARPAAAVYEAIADPAQLSQYFATGGARGRLEPGGEVTWDFADHPGRFPVTAVEADPPRRLVIAWDAIAGVADQTTVVFELEPVDAGARTLVTITESAWRNTPDGSQAAFRNCMGWTQMLDSLKAWIEHGIVLRDGYYS